MTAKAETKKPFNYDPNFRHVAATIRITLASREKRLVREVTVGGIGVMGADLFDCAIEQLFNEIEAESKKGKYKNFGTHIVYEDEESATINEEGYDRNEGEDWLKPQIIGMEIVGWAKA
jgi:hypothetical protein